MINYSKEISMLARPAMLRHFDFTEFENLLLVFDAKFIISKDNILHGLLGYFKTGLYKDISISTAPSDAKTHWNQIFFPMEKAVKACRRDKIDCKVKAISHNEILYWKWDTTIF